MIRHQHQIADIALNETNAKIVEAVKQHGFILIDDHESHRVSRITAKAVACYSRDGRQDIVALFNSQFSPYYSINTIKLDKDGVPHLTRDSRSTMHNATLNVDADVYAWYRGIDWALVEKHPCLHPGQLTNLVMA
jgi:hypothetical protein